MAMTENVGIRFTRGIYYTSVKDIMPTLYSVQVHLYLQISRVYVRYTPTQQWVIHIRYPSDKRAQQRELTHARRPVV